MTDDLKARRVPRIHCITYRQLAVLKIVLDKLGKKLAPKDAERLVVPKNGEPHSGGVGDQR